MFQKFLERESHDITTPDENGIQTSTNINTQTSSFETETVVVSSSQVANDSFVVESTQSSNSHND